MLTSVFHTMQDNSAAIFIPARLGSTRFPRKVLEPINGKPLIIRVLDRARELDLCDCYVACCCEEVKQVVESYGGTAIVTDPELPSGTDRIYAALKTLEASGKNPQFVINLQGDTPVFDSRILPELLTVLKTNANVDIATPVVLHKELDEIANKNLVKVVFDGMDVERPGRAAYFSRSPIPANAPYFYSHIGIYIYRRAALERFVHLQQSFLEKVEKLEQLRAIQAGMNVWAVPTTGMALSVDVRDDLAPVLSALERGS
ncbi:MAG: 3-deoxy-manno-octulosonate cytidylyltransferase [Alphaproteobacteria bacterium]|nr:3-deoxy-manno-octulosonate cytidylyltransferase [Alphaproteobacteria bacterium]